MIRGVTAPILALVLTTGSVSAQESSGYYLGVFVGGVDGSNKHSWNGNPAGDDVDVDGASFGGIFGQNWRSGQAVFGYDLSAAVSSANGFQRGGQTPCITPGEACTNELEGYANLNGRFGFETRQSVFAYFTAGATIGDVFATADTGACAGVPCTLDEIRVGYNVGIGIEGPIGNDWRLRGELSYIDLGEETMDGSTNNVEAEFQFTTLNIGLVRVY